MLWQCYLPFVQANGVTVPKYLLFSSLFHPRIQEMPVTLLKEGIFLSFPERSRKWSDIPGAHPTHLTAHSSGLWQAQAWEMRWWVSMMLQPWVRRLKMSWSYQHHLPHRPTGTTKGNNTELLANCEALYNSSYYYWERTPFLTWKSR